MPISSARSREERTCRNPTTSFSPGKRTEGASITLKGRRIRTDSANSLSKEHESMHGPSKSPQYTSALRRCDQWDADTQPDVAVGWPTAAICVQDFDARGVVQFTI